MIRLRAAVPNDRDFLQQVYASSREAELMQVNWTEQQKADFLLMQFNAQHKHYTEHFPEASFQVILKNKQPIGRLYVEHAEDQIRLIDIAVLPEFQGLGIGGGLLRSLIGDAQESNLPLRIHVEKYNPALNLYERLGFKPIGDSGVYLQMEWTN